MTQPFRYRKGQSQSGAQDGRMTDRRAGEDEGTVPDPATPPPVAAGPTPVPSAPKPRAWRKAKRHRARFSLTLVLTLILMALGFGYLTLATTGKSLSLPTLAVVEIEERLNASLAGARLSEGAAVSLGGVEFAVDADFVPRFRLQDIRLLDGAGLSLMSLPEALVAFDPKALLSGQIRPRAVRLLGARLALRRDADGRLNLAFGTGTKTMGEMLSAVDTLLASPGLSLLGAIEAEGLTLTLTDDRAKRSWQVGDGRLVIENRPTAVAAELALTLLDDDAPAQATLKLVSAKGGGAARLIATVDGVAAADLAAIAAPLAFLGVVRAPISGALEANFGAEGALASLTADLELAAGIIAPGAAAQPIAFDRAALSLQYDPVKGRLALTDLAVDSASLRLKATGHGDLLGPSGGPLASGQIPSTIVAQIAFSEVMVDPDGLFAEPVRFTQGALDLRLRLDPFRLDIGQLALVEGGERLSLSGFAEVGTEDWRAALDIGLDRIEADRLLKLWPVSAVPRTRNWLAANVGAATLTDVRAAFRIVPGEAPRFSIGYEFAEAEVRFVRTLPPVLDARGHATLEGTTYTVKLDRGHVIPPEGGRIEADGSVFQVIDVTRIPANAKITLVTSSTLTATLSLLDQEPFSFFSKAGQPVNLGQGRAELRTTLTMPLIPKVTLPEVDFAVTGRIVDFSSPALVAGRILSAPEVAVEVDTKGLALSGKGMLDLLPIDLSYAQGFGPEQKGRARINGTVTLSDAALRDLGVELPEGSVRGEGPAAIDIALAKGLPPQLTLTSNLVGLSLRLDALGWSKRAETRASLDLEARLSRTPSVDRLRLEAPGLTAEGKITTAEGGGLETARFSRLTVGGWLDAPVTLAGTGRGNALDIAITGGTLDLRELPESGAGQGGAPVEVNLDRLVISEGIALTGFQGAFSGSGGLNGRFTARVNDGGPVAGIVAPAEGGSAVRITSDDAGAVLASAGILTNARGGGLDMSLFPRGPEGHFTGSADFSSLRVQDAPALAALLSAVSVVGLLEQLDGEGLSFSSGEVDFILTPDAVEITQGSAVGASLGISFAGLYLTGSDRLDLQGVISPIYLVNGVGQIVSRRGEGLFGFNYRLSGTADAPDVSINPLSVLTPGIFREIFRSAPPTLEDGG